MHTSSRLARRIALVLPLLAAAACATASQRPASAPAADAATSGQVRALSADAGPVRLDNLTPGGDVGPARDALGHAAPAAEGRAGEAGKVSTRTKALIVVGLAAAAVAAILLFGVHSECECVHP